MTDGQKAMLFVVIAFIICGLAGMCVIAHALNDSISILATGVAATPLPR